MPEWGYNKFRYRRRLRTVRQWLRRVSAEWRDDTATSRRGARGGGRYVTLERDVGGRVDVVMTSLPGSTHESRLVVDDVTPADAGLYICSLSTAAGHVASRHAYLTVRTGIYAAN